MCDLPGRTTAVRPSAAGAPALTHPWNSACEGRLLTSIGGGRIGFPGERIHRRLPKRRYAQSPKGNRMRTTTASCPPESVLSDFGLGKLDAGSAEAISQHLESCADCREGVKKLSRAGVVSRPRKATRSVTVADRGHASFVPGESTGNFAGDSETPLMDPLQNRERSEDIRRAGTEMVPPELTSSPDYNVLKQLGQGGIGTVYLARNRMMDRLEVLKVVNPALLEHAGALERFQQEIRAAARLNHANIVAAYRVLRPGDLLVFAMEYVDGQDLARLVRRRGSVPVANAAYYAHQAALGLDHAFQKGIVHGDIKPANLMLAIEGKKHVIKVSDFGLANAARASSAETGLTNSGQWLDTPEYLAPEQTVGRQPADIRADIYSLGCTLYCVLSGQPPFPGRPPAEVWNAHQTRAAPPLNHNRPEIPVELAAVVAKMMANDPGERYQTPGDVAKALVPFFKPGATRAAVAPRPMPVAVPPGLSQPSVTVLLGGPRRKARRPLRFAALSGAATLLVLLFGVLLWLNKPPQGEPQKRLAGTVAAAKATPNLEPQVNQPIDPEKPAIDDRDSTTVPAAGPPSRLIDLVELKKHGAFRFPQERAQVLCDDDELRVSLWNNHEYLYVQAIVWNDHEDVVDLAGGFTTTDNSILTLVGAADLSITPNVDRRYHLSTRLGFSHSILTGTSESFAGGTQTRGRGVIRYLDLGDGQHLRLDCLLVPLEEIDKQPGDQIGVGFKALSFNPFVQYESHTGGGVHAVILAHNREPLDPRDVTRGPQPVPPRAADNPPEPIAHFLFNDNGHDEVSDATLVELKNVEYRDDALYINGLHARNGGGYEATANLVSEDMDFRRFTVALRFKASAFDAAHDTLLAACDRRQGTDTPSLFRLFRSQEGNLCVSVGQDKYLHEFTASRIDANHWTTVACGVDLEAGKCIAYLNGAPAGEPDIPHDAQSENVGWMRPLWKFGNQSRGSVYHGLVDELIIYDKLLAPDEFATIPLRVDAASPRASRHPRASTAEALAQAAANAAAKSKGVPSKLVAHFLFNGNAADELQQANYPMLRNVSFRDGAMFLKGQPLSSDASNIDYVILHSRPLDMSHFTVAVRFKADDFADKHTFILGAGWDSWFGLCRMDSGNLAFSLNGGEFYREVQTAKLEPGRWTVVACGVDLNLGKAIVYFNGTVAGEFDISKTLERRKESLAESVYQSWTFQRLDQKLHGLVDELLIYDQLLTHDEFAKIPLRVEAAPERGQ